MKEFLDRWHEERVENWKWYFKEIAKIIVNEFNPKNILDIGYADGLLLECFYKHGVECYGVDISKEALSYAPEELKPNLILLDIEKRDLPFKDNTFDVITILEVLEHLHNHRRIISEMYRVLKPGGIVLMSTPTESKVYRFINKIVQKFVKTSSQVSDFDICGFSPHINVHPKKFWVKEFESVGFTLLEDFKKSHKGLIKEVIKMHKPKDPIAKFLLHFPFGKNLRIMLAYQLWSTTLLFKKEV